MIFLILILTSYIIGSFPTAVWVGKIFHNIDIREHGECNVEQQTHFEYWEINGVDCIICGYWKGYLAASLPFSE